MRELRPFLRDLYQSMALGTALYRRYADMRGVSYPDLAILYALSDMGESTQREIGMYYEMNKQTVNAAVRHLKELGYVTLSTDEADKRRRVLRLTEAGEAYARQFTDMLFAIEERAAVRLGEKNLVRAKNVLDDFNILFAEELNRL